MKRERRLAMALGVALVIAMATLAGGCLKDDDGDGDGNGDGDGDNEVVANAGDDIVGIAGQPVAFNGSLSSGDITLYWWDFDRGNASDPLTKDAVGVNAQYTYTEAGVYTVTLVVEGEEDASSNDTLTARIDHVEDVTGTVSPVPGSINATYDLDVKEGAQAIEFTLTYASGGSLPVPTNALDVFVYIDDDQVPEASTSSQLPDQGDTQTEELELDGTQIAQALAEGSLSVQVRYISGDPGGVEFTLSIGIYYHAV